MKIGIFTDSHYSSKEISNKTRRPSLSFEKIKQALEAFKDVDCVICLGDLVDICDSYRESEAKLRAVGALIRDFGVPFYCLRGNHDCDIFTSKQFYSVLGFDRPEFVIKNGEKRLVFLDANYDVNEAEYIPGNVDWTQTMLPSDQLEALANVLNDQDASEIYVFMHQNIDPDVQWQHILSNADQVRKMLAASGKVRVVIQGHFHPGHDNVLDGIRYHTLPAMCEGERNYFEIMEI